MPPVRIAGVRYRLVDTTSPRMIGAASHETNCGDPTLLDSMRVTTRHSANGGKSARKDAPLRVARIPSLMMVTERTTMSGVASVAAVSTPGPHSWKVRMSNEYRTPTARFPATICHNQKIANGDSTCNPRPACSATNPIAFTPAPASRLITRMAALSDAVTTNTLSRRRELTTRAAITAAGQTFIHIATVSNAVANRGRLPAHNSPRIATGTVTVSIRPSATGPSRARKKIHHHAAIRRRRDSDADPNRLEKAMPFSRVTSTSQVVPYRTGPNNSATAIGAKARIGYTQGVSIPIRESPVCACSAQLR